MVAQAERSNRVWLGQIAERLVKRSVAQLASCLPPSPPHRCLHRSRCCKHIYLETAHTNFAIGIFRERKIFAFPPK